MTPHPLLLFDAGVICGICRPDRAEHVATAVRHDVGIGHREQGVALGLDGRERRLHLIGDEVEQGDHEVVRRGNRRQAGREVGMRFGHAPEECRVAADVGQQQEAAREAGFGALGHGDDHRTRRKPSGRQ